MNYTLHAIGTYKYNLDLIKASLIKEDENFLCQRCIVKIIYLFTVRFLQHIPCSHERM